MGPMGRIRCISGRSEWSDNAKFLLTRFFRQRLQHKITRANHYLREFQLAGFARELFIRIASAAESWFPFGIALGFAAQQALRGFPVGNRQIVAAPDIKLARLLK